MKRWRRRVGRAALLLAIALTVPAGTAGAALSDVYWENHLFQLPDPGTAYDREEAARMMNRIKRIEPQLLESLVYGGVRIRLITGSVTDEPEMASLRGVVPRGWEATGMTWDDIPGVGGNPVIVRIGYSAEGMNHGSLNLELHETFHAIDRYAFGELSASPAFEAAFREEAGRLFGGNRYEELYPEEYFAEAACMLYYGEATRAVLRERAPKTYALIDEAAASFKPTPPPIPALGGHWARPAMERLAGLRILAGYPDGTFRPDARVTREQFAKLLAEAAGIRTGDVPSESSFADVAPSSWAAPYIEALYTAGVADAASTSVERNGDKPRFRPQAPLTRLEMAAWTARALALEPADGAVGFRDAHRLGALAGLVGAAAEAGLVQGMPGGRFEPESLVTRAQASVLLNRVLDLPEREDSADEDRPMAGGKDVTAQEGAAAEDVVRQDGGGARDGVADSAEADEPVPNEPDDDGGSVMSESPATSGADDKTTIAGDGPAQAD